VGKDEGGGRRRCAHVLTIHNSYRPPKFFQDTDGSRFPPRKSSPLIDDAVASWHGFMMTLLLIIICQFSLAQPDCHFLLSPVELPVPPVGRGDCHFSTSLPWSLPSLRASREREICLESPALWVRGGDRHLCEDTSVRSSKDPVTGKSCGRAVREAD